MRVDGELGVRISTISTPRKTRLRENRCSDRRLNLSVTSTNSAKSERKPQSPATSSKVDPSASTDSRVEVQATPQRQPLHHLLGSATKESANAAEHEGVTMGMQALKTLFGLASFWLFFPFQAVSSRKAW